MRDARSVKRCGGSATWIIIWEAAGLGGYLDLHEGSQAGRILCRRSVPLKLEVEVWKFAQPPIADAASCTVTFPWKEDDVLLEIDGVEISQDCRCRLLLRSALAIFCEDGTVPLRDNAGCSLPTCAPVHNGFRPGKERIHFLHMVTKRSAGPHSGCPLLAQGLARGCCCGLQHPSTPSPGTKSQNPQGIESLNPSQNPIKPREAFEASAGYESVHLKVWREKSELEASSAEILSKRLDFCPWDSKFGFRV